MTNVKYTYCGNHFAIYTNIESLHCTVKTNIMLMSIRSQLKKNSYLDSISFGTTKGPENKSGEVFIS